MRSYKKYKNFIPDSFYLKIGEQRNRKQNILINLFVIFNLIFIPINFKNLNILAEKSTKLDENKSHSAEKGYELSTIIYTIEELISEDFEDMYEDVYINNDFGEIVINNFKIAERIEKSKLIEIKEASLIEDGKYKIGVAINEYYI